MRNEHIRDFIAFATLVAACWLVGWLYALVRAAPDERAEIAARIGGALLTLLFVAVLVSFIIAFILFLIAFPFYGRRTEAVPFRLFWLVSFIATVGIGALWTGRH
jgi:hypothetical protein